MYLVHVKLTCKILKYVCLNLGSSLQGNKLHYVCHKFTMSVSHSLLMFTDIYRCAWGGHTSDSSQFYGSTGNKVSAFYVVMVVSCASIDNRLYTFKGIR